MHQLLEMLREAAVELLDYSLVNVYKFLIYAFAYSSLMRKGLSVEALRPLERRMPSPIRIVARSEFAPIIHEILNRVDELLSKTKPVVVTEAHLGETVKAIRSRVGKVDAVLTYDCMSVIEQVALSAYLVKQGMRAVFLDVVFVNPLGRTSFVTKQLDAATHEKTLRGVTEYIAESLRAYISRKSTHVDKVVHEVGQIGLEEFVDRVSIESLAQEVSREVLRHPSGKVLLVSDHGYDIVLSRRDSFIYVVHGYASSKRDPEDVELAPFSKLVFFVVTIR